MNVFDDIERTDSSAAAYGESIFVFLNRVRSEWWSGIRALIETWCRELPEEARLDVRARLRSGDDGQFRGAFFELYCFIALCRAGYSIEVHPALDETSRRFPDFRVSGSDTEFIVEATIAEDTVQARGAARRQADFFDALNRLDSPNFYLDLTVERQGPRPPGVRAMRARVEAWIAQHDPDEVARLINEDGSLRSERCPEYLWKQDGWFVRIRLLPIRPDARGRSDHRAIGMHSPGSAYRVTDADAIRRRAEDKAGAYGEVDLPFLIAIELSTFIDHDLETMSALFGSDQVQFRTFADGRTEAVPLRATDGFFHGPDGWTNQHVAGVMVVRSLLPWRVDKEIATIWHHPYASRPLPVFPGPWRHAHLNVATGVVEFVDTAVQAQEHFELPVGWPGPDDWS